ncbi:hypothetical protein N7532_003674 [Penicillium argentinense]|uniref:Uncharacterized protein n=1 Tax=Penicillium argentinense TaxID=1131581 RepID=A0A9W9FNF7_9EURO|nr:uncharacterized protein N7532_003674 [Penicillium argentinense]KAJ5103145.1 hypothetical protein N7532_003674 [Penicillium argentinense]
MPPVWLRKKKAGGQNSDSAANGHSASAANGHGPSASNGHDASHPDGKLFRANIFTGEIQWIDESEAGPNGHHAPRDDDDSDVSGYEDNDDDSLIYDSEEYEVDYAYVIDIAKSTAAVEAFHNADTTHRNIDLRLAPLRGRENFTAWFTGIEIILRQHQVWTVFNPSSAERIKRIPKGHPLRPEWERMVDIVVAVIFANVCERIRNTPCFCSAIMCRRPVFLLNHLFSHYSNFAPDSDDEEEDFDDEKVDDSDKN